MKRVLICIALLCLAFPAAAQRGGRILRSELIPYDTRHDAVAGDRSKIDRYVEFRPEATRIEEEAVVVGQRIEIPYAWTDGLVFLHLENVGSAYALEINGREAGRSEDPFTPADYDVTPFVREGANEVTVALRESAAPELHEGIRPARARFTDSYLFGQHKRSVSDVAVRLMPDSTCRFGVLDLAIVARNGFNYPEQVTVAYDFYDPKGKLLEYDVREVTVDGRSADTVRFAPYIYHTYENKWAEKGRAPLYRLTVFTKRDGGMWEYMPVNVAFTGVEYRDGVLLRFGEEIPLSTASYNAAADRKTSEKQMKELKAKGFNTLTPGYPQPQWYYDLADELGLYVIDRASINAFERRADRTVGGTPANDPSMADEFVARVQAMYYRTRNHPSVIAYALGGPSGNGYAMYKAYEWLKSVESDRPIIYEDADGEWNTDEL